MQKFQKLGKEGEYCKEEISNKVELSEIDSLYLSDGRFYNSVMVSSVEGCGVV